MPGDRPWRLSTPAQAFPRQTTLLIGPTLVLRTAMFQSGIPQRTSGLRVVAVGVFLAAYWARSRISRRPERLPHSAQHICEYPMLYGDWHWQRGAAPTWGSCAGSAATAFSALTSSTNTSAAMVVGSGASLDFTGTGTIDANLVNGAVVPASAGFVATNTSRQLVAAAYTPANCTAGTTGSDCLQLTSGLVPVGNIPTAIPIANIGSAGLSGTAPVSIASTGAISMHVADASDNGYLSSTDWSTFNGKQAALSLIKGTYVDGDLCAYTASGTLLNCNVTPGGTGTVTDGSGTTTTPEFAESTGTAHVIQYRTASQALGDMGAQAALSLLAGTYTNGDWCSYASSGTLLNCNNAVPQVNLCHQGNLC